MDRPKNKRIKYDIRKGKVLEIDEKPDTELESPSSTQDTYDDYSSGSSSCSDDNVYDQSLLELDVDVCAIQMSSEDEEKPSICETSGCHKVDDVPNVPKEELMAMLPSDITNEERDAYGALFDKYPKLFAKDYTQMRGTNT